MSERTIVHLMRHGEVENPDGVLYGRLPEYFLSELGHKMAATVAEWLSKNEIVHLVASPLERAQQTAEPLSKILEVADPDRRPGHRGGQPLRGQDLRRGRRRPQASAELVDAAQPVPSVVG